LNTVAIVGVGLIGGSFGLALKKHGFSGRILGVSSAVTLAKALERGAIDEGARLAAAAEQADLIYLSQPVGQILGTLHQIDGMVRPGVLITDAGSTKGAIVAAARQSVRRAQFIGGHPLAGKEQRGVEEAEADLFAGRTWVLTPLNPADLETPAARGLIDWIGRIGSTAVVMDAEDHDRVVSFTSHLPQLASTVLAAVVAEHLSSPEQLRVSGPGLLDSTRLARSPYEVWRDILETNAEAIDRALAAYIARLEHLRANVRSPAVAEEFARASELAERLRK